LDPDEAVGKKKSEGGRERAVGRDRTWMRPKEEKIIATI
jgi:hypothetical protein